MRLTLEMAKESVPTISASEPWRRCQAISIVTASDVDPLSGEIDFQGHRHRRVATAEHRPAGAFKPLAAEHFARWARGRGRPSGGRLRRRWACAVLDEAAYRLIPLERRPHHDRLRRSCLSGFVYTGGSHRRHRGSTPAHPANTRRDDPAAATPTFVGSDQTGTVLRQTGRPAGRPGLALSTTTGHATPRGISTSAASPPWPAPPALASGILRLLGDQGIARQQEGGERCVAFRSAVRVTFVASITPAFTRSSYSSAAAL